MIRLDKNTKKIRSIYSIVLSAAVMLCVSCSHDDGHNSELPEEDLSRLNKAMKASNLYMHDKNRVLDSIKTKLNSVRKGDYAGKWKYAYELATGYLPFRADSSLHYAEMAFKIAKEGNLPQKEIESRIARINALSTAGIFVRAIEELDSVAVRKMDNDMKLHYWSAGRKLYGYMRAYVEGDPEFFSEYSQKYYQYDDSLVAHLPANNYFRRFYEAEKLVNGGRFVEGKKILEKLCADLPEDSNLYAMSAFQMGLVYKNEGNSEAYASYMAKAAVSDIRNCVKDGLALPALAEWLYHKGELNLAFKYINFALEDAMIGNVRMRTVTIAALLPVIDEAYREKINASRDELMIYFLLVTVLLIATIGLVAILMRVVKKSRDATGKLARTAEIQESYIGHFIGLCSTYANRLESLQKLVVRKLASGQCEELHQIIKSGKFNEGQNEEFYKIFDSAFLDIYPDFIEGINSLLRPEEKIELKKEKELSPELRIYAFVKLGVEESTRIAQILNYSVSTVYSYRNRMRNRARDRENFDNQVLQLGRK